MSNPEDAAMDPPTDTTTADAPPSLGTLTTKLADLKASATQQYSLKNYPAAAEFYSEAAEVQDQLHGEMSPENADLLYQYGRCLYHVAVSNSDVLGGKVASSEEPKRKKRKTVKAEGNGEGSSKAGTGLIGNAMKGGGATAVDGKAEVKKEDGDAAAANKPYFQITGDENWTDSEDSEDEDAAADAEAEEEEDDFAIAYEILDVARVLLQRKLEQQDGDVEQQRQIQERLADTHDLQAEINLENERFTDAINDTRDALKLKLALYPEESSILAEAHFKLSLALEFASVTSTSEDSAPAADGANESTAQVDTALRAEAASEMELAIASCTARIAKETAVLSTLDANPSKRAEQERSIADVKEMVADMKQRLVDLRNPAVSLSGMNATPEVGDGSGVALKGVLGAMLGEGGEGRKQKLEEVTKGANDLSGMVKKRKKVEVEAPVAGQEGEKVVEGKGKRKVGDVEGGSEEGVGKKVKFAEEGA
ncbi:uncharacterized protein LTR77_005960 [Saxophila tyrrhenica]|uniref:Tetratricopeptide SHNi-TPR domain-containing protein n=1 Tax=Saxophila tyrrhenica TaxID=1690608 RepID=A0AAV9P8P2_9PEZI|nr:hypothetical protein LTR77_005960 [Saxophila tyrrhenica]